MTYSRPFAARASKIAERRARPALGGDLLIALISNGLNPKAQLLLLCARIGYTPHVSFQR